MYKQSFKNGLICILLAGLFVASLSSSILMTKYFGLSLEIELKTSSDNVRIQVFYDTGKGFNVQQSSHANITGNYFQSVKIPLLSFLDFKKLRRARIDLGVKPGEHFIKDIRLKAFFYDYNWSSQDILNSFKKVKHIEEISKKDDLVYIKCNGDDPGIFVAIPNNIQSIFLFSNVFASCTLMFIFFIISFFAFRKRRVFTQYYCFAEERLDKKTGSRLYYFILILVFIWFLFQLFYFALNISFRISPDEHTHYMLSSLYYNIKSIFLENSPNTYRFGPVSTIPYLYYLLMGKSLNLNLLNLDPVVFLRCVNILISVLSLLFSYLLIREISPNRYFILGCLMVQSNILMYVFLSAMISYDNLTNLLAVCSTYILIKFLKTYSRYYLELFLLLITAGMLTKITFGPLIIIYLFIFFINIKKVVKNKFKWLKQKFSKKEILLIVFILLFVGLNANLYIANMIKYNQVRPSCEKVLDYEDCLNWGIFARNEKLLSTIESRKEKVMGIDKYLIQWFWRIETGVFGIFGHKVMFKTHRQILPCNLFILFSLILYCMNYKMLLNERWLRYILFISFSYICVIFYINHHLYNKYLVFSLALQGRYIFPVLVPLIIAILYPLYHTGKNAFSMLFFLISSFIFLNGSFFYFLRNESEVWLK